MKNLALSAILVLSSGCIISTNGDGDDTKGDIPIDGSGAFDVSWSVVACPLDGAARVLSLETTTQQMNTDIFDCSAGGGLTNAVALGEYDVWVEILDQDLTTVYATSFAHLTPLDFDGETAVVTTTPVYASDGFFSLAWTIASTGGGALSCEGANANGVRVVATLANTTEGVANIFDCDAGSGLTNPVAAGLYTIVVDIMDNADLSIADSGAFEETAVADSIVDLSTFDFEFDL